MGWPQFVEWGFQGLITVAAIVGAKAMGKIGDKMDKLSGSVDDLNKQMATIIERDVWHTKWLERHDDEIKNLNCMKAKR